VITKVSSIALLIGAALVGTTSAHAVSSTTLTDTVAVAATKNVKVAWGVGYKKSKKVASRGYDPSAGSVGYKKKKTTTK
jgi:hypothetical protein